MTRKLGKKRKEKKLVKPDNWNVFVACPAYDGKVDSDFAMSLANATYCAPLYQVQMSASIMANGAFIDLARNIFVKIFLDDFKECTHLFFIDSDLKFTEQAFIGLIRAGLPICAGVYPRRQSPPDYPVKFTEHKDGGLWVEDDWIMADRVPTGFLCIERKILEEMAADAVQMDIHGQDGPVPQLFYTKLSEDNKFIGEDYTFCDDYRKKYGKPIPVWGNFDFVHGGYEGNLQKHLEQQIEQDEKDVSAA